MSRRISDKMYANWFEVIRAYNEQGVYDFGLISAELGDEKWDKSLGRQYDIWIVRYAEGRRKRIEDGKSLPKDIQGVLDAFVAAYIPDYFICKGELDVKQEINDHWDEWKNTSTGIVFSYLVDVSDNISCAFAYCKILEARRKLKRGFKIKAHMPYMFLRKP